MAPDVLEGDAIATPRSARPLRSSVKNSCTIMGYDLAIPATVIIAVPGVIFATLFLQRRSEKKRLDFRKGTTYENPQDEDTPQVPGRDRQNSPP
jgi:hypothetical protein